MTYDAAMLEQMSDQIHSDFYYRLASETNKRFLEGSPVDFHSFIP